MFEKLRRASLGVKAPHRKMTSDGYTVKMPIPDVVTLPVQQHIGAPAKPVVKKGDKVQVGTVVAEAGGFVSSPIHSSVSGTVKELKTVQLAGGKTECIVIESDKEQTLSKDIAPPIVNDHASFVEAIRQSGLVGLGGAGFPTSVKLSPKDLSAVDTLVINAAECEPYITADNREMLECADHVMSGIMLVKRYLNLKKVFIGIEQNKPEAMDLLISLATGDKSVRVIPLETRYPQGAEKVLIEKLTGKEVPEGGLPSDVGVIVLNVSTVAFISKYLETGIPLTTKRLTVSGDLIKEPKNVEAYIGTSIEDVVEFCGGFISDPCKVLMGGPMMGFSLPNLQLPVQKQSNAVLALSERVASIPEPTPCIHCARCIEACPMGLPPVEIVRAYELAEREELTKLKVSSCIECGCCSFTCPAKRPLAPTMKLAKVVERTGVV